MRVLVPFHVAGILVMGYLVHENLVKSMVSGKKRSPNGDVST